jgi:DNA-binding NarL/FixJ family response regulator
MPAADALVTVIVVDKQPIFRAGVKHALGTADPPLQVIGEAADGGDVLRLVEELAPQVVLLNADVEGLHGLEAIRAIRRTGRTTSVIVISVDDDEEQLFSAITFGAAAYLRTSIGIVALCAVIRAVADGQYPINDSVLAKPDVAARVLAAFRSLANHADTPAASWYVPLSARELQVLSSVARGNTNRYVAHVLGISDQTVKNHITSIMRKLAVNDRTQAVVHALHHGWITA